MKNNFLKKNLLLMIVVAITLSIPNDLCAQQQQQKVTIGYVPKNGFVPDKTTAIRIAVAVWLPIYGNSIYKEQPFNAILKNGVWTVTGSLPRGNIGGVAMIRIQKSDGKILRVIHGK